MPKADDSFELFQSVANIPLSIFLPVVLSVACVLSLLTIYFWKCLRKKQRKEAQLAAIVPKGPGPHVYAGVRADQPIKFVVPTITVSETSHFMTEDSMSESDCLSSYGYSSDREMRQNGRFQINANEIQKSLYQAENNNNNNQDQNGTISFVMHYSYYRQQLLVTLLSAKNLPKKRHNINPFAKLSLLPDKTPKYVTKVFKNNDNPSFNELFAFPARIVNLNERKLKITVWNSDSFSRKSLIGQCIYPLKDAGIDNEINSDVISENICCDLVGHRTTSGELLLSLTYKPESSTLTLSVLKLRNLVIREIQTVYVKVVLYLRKKRIRSRKSLIRKMQPEIEFNDTFHVHVTNQVLSDIIIGVTVYGRTASIGSKHLIGRTHVGEFCPSELGKQHWNDMKIHVNSTVNHWHLLG